jgi:uridine kinase
MSSGKSVIVLIGGGHACGKKTTAMLLKQELEKTLVNSSINVELVDMSDYEEKSTVNYSSTTTNAITIDNYEKLQAALKPSRFDFVKIRSFLQNNESKQSQTIYLVYGLYALYDKQLRDMSNIKVFISSDADVRLIRWIKRDVVNGEKLTLNYVLNSYLQGAKQEMNNYIITTKEYADVIMPRGADSNAVNLILDGVFKNLYNVKYGLNIESFLRPSDDSRVYDQYHVMKHNYYELN